MSNTKSKGRLLARGDAGFEAAVKSSSFSVEDTGRRPAFVCEAESGDDIVEAVRLAEEKGMQVSICSGGHSWAQNHIRDGGLMLNLSQMTGIEIDAPNKTAIIGPAVLGGDFDKALSRKGLYFPVPHVYSVGMGGFLLQGGFGWNSRVVGLACESVIGIDVVLANGQRVHASETENSDLLWAARGAGPGFFGVVERFHLRLYDRPKFTGVKVQIFRIALLEAFMEWADSIKSELSPQVELAVNISRNTPGIFAHGIQVAACVMADSRSEAKKLLAILEDGPLRSQASLNLPLLGTSLGRIMKTAESTVAKDNCRWFTDNAWLKSPISPALPTIRQIADGVPDAPSHIYWQVWNPKGGRPDMAFSLEGDSYFAIYGAFKLGKGTPDQERWSTESAKALQNYSVGIQLADENLARRPDQFMAPENFEKLQDIRRKYDPQGRFFSYAHLPGNSK